MRPRLPSTYQAFGLRMQSALPLPELREAGDDTGAADVVITRGPASRPDAGLPLSEPNVCAGPDLFWLDVAGVVRLLVRDGRGIEFAPADTATDGNVRAFLLGSGIGAVLHQRGWLPLHASAVEIGGRAIAFIAPSGGGKSTMAMHLHQLGHRVLCDDICAIDFGGGAPRLWPGLRNLKLWGAALDVIGRAPDDLEPVVAGLDKYRLPMADLPDYRPYDLAGMVLLEWGETVGVAALSGAESMSSLIANTYRGFLVAPMGRTAAHWRQCIELIRAVPMHRLRRPRNLAGLAAASEAVLALDRSTQDTRLAPGS